MTCSYCRPYLPDDSCTRTFGVCLCDCHLVPLESIITVTRINVYDPNGLIIRQGEKTTTDY